QDGVPDGLDKCPGTPAGAHVDATGCPTDADADGVPDGLDQYPNTPAGLKVDAKGCPIDSDADGVPDGVDQCPDTPAGVAVDAKGCPMDADGDGVPDGLDRCPNTPKGATVDANGCPLDSDLDGVPDGIDQCPNTPAGTKVDATGCPLPVEAVRAPTAQAAAPAKCPPAPPGSQVDANGCLVLFAPEPARPAAPGAPAPRPTLVLRGVNFETGRSVLTRDSYLVLDAVAASLVANPEIRIEVAGYTDSTGTKFSNLRLSQARAAAVRLYLARKGVAPVRMVAKGYGASGYVAPNAPAAARIPPPRAVLGFDPGEDRKLADWPTLVRYYQALAKASDRIRYRELGHTTLGAPFLALAISSPQNLRLLDRYRELNATLADPRARRAQDVDEALRSGKAIVLITSGIHSNEVGGHLTAALLAYRPASDT